MDGKIYVILAGLIAVAVICTAGVILHSIGGYHIELTPIIATVGAAGGIALICHEFGYSAGRNKALNDRYPGYGRSILCTFPRGMDSYQDRLDFLNRDRESGCTKIESAKANDCSGVSAPAIRAISQRASVMIDLRTLPEDPHAALFTLTPGEYSAICRTLAPETAFQPVRAGARLEQCGNKTIAQSVLAPLCGPAAQTPESKRPRFSEAFSHSVVVGRLPEYQFVLTEDEFHSCQQKTPQHATPALCSSQLCIRPTADGPSGRCWNTV
ncbi:hypothetical protein [Pseudomonas aeruginosa]|uniref:hypothetical protein n=1 Tax=Pseudomonas aeruginosa TaxID=287 RepID=UPI003DA98888